MTVRKVCIWALILLLTPLHVQATLPNLASPDTRPRSAAPATTAPGARLTGRLTADGPVTINGNRAQNGDTIFSGALIRTSAGVGATVQLGALGQLDIAPESILTVNFDSGNVRGNITTGCAVLIVSKGVNGSLTLPRGATKNTDGLNSTTLNACTDEFGSDMDTSGAKSTRLGRKKPGAINLGGNSVGLLELGNLLLGSSAVMMGIGPRNGGGSGGGNCGGCASCCCCCCCNPSPCAPCR